MSSADTAAITQAIANVDASLRTQHFCYVALPVLLVYDVILTSGQEYQYVWRSSKSSASRVLYVWNRYLAPLYNILDIGFVFSMSDTSCTGLVWLTGTVLYLNLLGPAIFTTLRIYALSRKNRVLGGLALVLSMAPFAINLAHYHFTKPINLPAPANCEILLRISPSLNTACLILEDSLAVAVTWYQARLANVFKTSTMCRPSLEQVMWENGTVYFCAIVSMNVVDVVLVLLSITIEPGGSAYILQFIDPISSILNSRFLLALHETNARLEGANASISSLSLEINSSGEPRDRSSGLPAFLAAVGGPIHSFPYHDDDDWGTLEFAAPSQGGDFEAGAEAEAVAGAGVKTDTVAEGGADSSAALGGEIVDVA